MSAPALADDASPDSLQICTTLSSVPSVPTDDRVYVAGKTFSIKGGFFGWKIRPAVEALLASETASAVESIRGPYGDMRSAMDSILYYYKRSFGVKFNRSTVGNSRSGPKQEIICVCANCPFRMNYELCKVNIGDNTTYKWILIQADSKHSDHEMSESLAQKNSSSAIQRDLPQDVLADAKLLFTVGQMDVPQIHAYLLKKFQETREITWTLKDLANALAEDPTCKLHLQHFFSTMILLSLY